MRVCYDFFQGSTGNEWPVSREGVASEKASRPYKKQKVIPDSASNAETASDQSLATGESLSAGKVNNDAVLKDVGLSSLSIGCQASIEAPGLASQKIKNENVSETDNDEALALALQESLYEADIIAGKPDAANANIQDGEDEDPLPHDATEGHNRRRS